MYVTHFNNITVRPSAPCEWEKEEKNTICERLLVSKAEKIVANAAGLAV